ncbi:hypothetical protein [Parachitinimonas caeni]|uniref:Uncharacterized protein n=1 Tax=Parachitinimonas caeni TaxID=3031301 RepID=A0ABT7E5X6_9NEIS|nr:hypothetical protein [Parachitinimonas caeni]MDK2126758.1 hypothetical protein [Parachitinimonas caeni]
MRLRKRQASPCFMKAKFASVCPETGKAIQPGDEIAYYPSTQQAFHVDSKSAGQLRDLAFATAYGMTDAKY